VASKLARRYGLDASGTGKETTGTESSEHSNTPLGAIRGGDF